MSFILLIIDIIYYNIKDMDSNMGSFGSAIGGSGALMEAMKRRGMDVGMGQVQSPASAGGGAPVAPMNDMQAASAALPQAPQQPAPPDSDVTIATKALATMVTNDSKMKKDLATMRTQGTM